jgi:hypothetical protein
VINVHDLHEDVLFPNDLNCPYYIELHQFMKKFDLFTKHNEYIKSLNELKDSLKFLNHHQTANISFVAFRDDMIARKVHNLPVPDHLHDLIKKSDRYANMEMTSIAA